MGFTYQHPRHNHNNEPWTADEALLLYQKVRTLGTRWALMQVNFPGRTAAWIKNRWYTVVSKREQMILADTEKMLDIRCRMRLGAAIPEICRGDHTERGDFFPGTASINF
jgi:hypothetical protein